MRSRAACEKVHALQDLAVGYPGRDKPNVVPAREVLSAIDAGLVGDPHLLRPTPLLPTSEAKPAEDLGPEAAERGGGEHAFWRAARSHDRVHVGSGDRDGKRSHEVAIFDELDASARRAHVVDELFVSRAVEDDDGEIADVAIQ